jgi:hypothetical protein
MSAIAALARADEGKSRIDRNADPQHVRFKLG